MKILGGFVIGMFVGALCVEILARTRPELVNAIADKAEDAVNLFNGEGPVCKQSEGEPC